MGKLLKTEVEVEWLNYPKEFSRVVDLNLCNLDPWIILEGDQLKTRYQGMKERYPQRSLVPFARREDNDDVACFEKNTPNRVVLIHDFASPGYEHVKVYSNFWQWFREAVEEMISFTY